MDYGLITGTLSALTALKDLGQSAAGIRDAAKLSSIVVQMNEQILSVQNNLYRHQADLMALQQQYHDAQRELHVLKDRESERGRYVLFEPYPGNFAYRLLQEHAKPGEPVHMLCQPCFDAGKKSVLRAMSESWAQCPLCKEGIDTGPSRTLGYAEPDWP